MRENSQYVPGATPVALPLKSEIASAVSAQEQAVGALLETLSELRTRLSPVLMPIPTNSADKRCNPGYGSPLANAIGDHTARLEDARAFVTAILSELAV